jgi:hypothetical protein
MEGNDKMEIVDKKKEKDKRKKEKLKQQFKNRDKSSFEYESDVEDESSSSEHVAVKKEEGLIAKNTLASSEVMRMKEDLELKQAERKSKRATRSAEKGAQSSKKSKLVQKEKVASPKSVVIPNRPGHYQPDELKEVLHGIYVQKDDNAIAKDVFALSPGRNQASLKAKVAKIREEMKIIVNTLTQDDIEIADKGMM